jgi:hypothetical protein
MQRFAPNLAVALFTFGIGVLLWFASPLRLLRPQPLEPLRLTLLQEKKTASSDVAFDHDILTIENVSSKTIHGYSLGRTCNCRGQGTYGPYPDGIIFSNPNPARQILEPGESQTQFLFRDDLPIDQLKIWPDLVHFTDGTNWGPNQGRTEGYVRALE